MSGKRVKRSLVTEEKSTDSEDIFGFSNSEEDDDEPLFCGSRSTDRAVNKRPGTILIYPISKEILW